MAAENPSAACSHAFEGGLLNDQLIRPPLDSRFPVHRRRRCIAEHTGIYLAGRPRHPVYLIIEERQMPII
jgi:hypothetical protein